MNKYQKPTGSYISFMSNKVKSQGGINLAQGIPGFQPPRELLQHLSDLAFEAIHQYAPGDGNNDLLNLLLEKYSQYGKFEPENFLITNGATEAVSLLYTYFNHILDKPYSALAFEPVYESYKKLPAIFGDRFISFPFQDDGKVNFDKLNETCRANRVKVIFLNTPGNPFGKIWNKEEIEALDQLARQEDIFIVVDAVYQELYYNKPPYHPISSFSERMFYVNSFSKIFSITGWRIGYMIASQEHMQVIKSTHDYTGLCAPSILQEAIVKYIKKNNWGSGYIEGLRKKLKDGFDVMKQGLEELGFYVPSIGGGFFIWAALPEGWEDGFRFTIDLYDQQKVAVIPGEHFSERHTHYIRFNIAREKEELAEALKRIQQFMG
ncbi:MAG: pyridoxal phosphate-dependent aminotransferase [Bacteroidales bacterium]|nr:pyridoxal phosphate-dependent aminotransferase [Bacteroidales bacterium]